MDIRQPTRIAMQCSTGAFNNVLENDWVGKATEATSETISGMLADTNNFEKKT